MVAFFLAMSMFPEVQRKAQEEIDRVVSPGRLPKPSDRENLYYVNALVEEAQRWHPIGPMGLPTPWTKTMQSTASAFPRERCSSRPSGDSLEIGRPTTIPKSSNQRGSFLRKMSPWQNAGDFRVRETYLSRQSPR
jgi:hypothetical protein